MPFLPNLFMEKAYEAVKDWYNNNLDTYLKSGDVLMKDKLNRFLKYLPNKGMIIDIGSGTGRDVEYFTRKGRVAVGVDFSEKMVQFSRKNRTGGMFKNIDIRSGKITFKDESVDGVWDSSALFTHSEPKDICKVLSKISRWLNKKGIYGTIIMKKKSSVTLKKPKNYVFNEFSKDEVVLLLKLNDLDPFYFQEFEAHSRKWFYILAKRS